MNDQVTKYFSLLHCNAQILYFLQWSSLLIKQAQTPVVGIGWYCPLQTTSNTNDNNNNKGIYHLLIVPAAVLFLLVRSLC